MPVAAAAFALPVATPAAYAFDVAAAVLAEATAAPVAMPTMAPAAAVQHQDPGGAQEFLRVAGWLPLFPGLAITGTAVGLNLLGDAFSSHLGGK